MGIWNPPPTAVPTAHHTTHETGGTDVVAAIDGSVITTGAVAAARGGTGVSTGLTVLNASNVTTGTLPVAQLPATVARTDVSNSFTGGTQDFPNIAAIRLRNPADPANQRAWHFAVNASKFYLQCVDDSFTATGVYPVTCDRSGNLLVWQDISEKGRTTPLGHWNDVPFNATNFSIPSSSWTVASGNVSMNRYMAIGKTVWWSLYLIGTTIGSTPPNLLYLTFPFGTLRGFSNIQPAARIVNAGTDTMAEAFVLDSTRIQIWKVPGQGAYTAGTLELHMLVAFEIN